LGTWDAGPFDNDDAADFAGELDDTPEGERVALIRSVLTAAVENNTYLDSDEGAPAVAAAAIVAYRLPGGEQFAPNGHGPEAPVPDLPADLVPLAIDALDRVLAADSELASLWAESSRGQGPWHTSILQLKSVLLKSTTAGMDPLFEIGP
jgi:hypothetical protein